MSDVQPKQSAASRLVASLRCPLCARALRIEGATVRCADNHSFPVAEGVPVLLRERRDADHYAGQIKYFTAESSSYSEEHVLAPWMRKFVDLVATQFGPVREGALALDIGCGTGYMAIELARMGYSVIAADLTPSTMFVLARKVARMGLQDRILPVICSALDLPVRDTAIDAVVANAVIEHLPDDQRFAEEMARVMASSGHALCIAPIKFRYVWPFFWPVNYIHDRRIGHLRRYDVQSFRRLFAPLGLSISHVGYTGHLVKVAGALVQTLCRTPVWDDALERIDARSSSRAFGSSNIVVVASKPPA